MTLSTNIFFPLCCAWDLEKWNKDVQNHHIHFLTIAIKYGSMHGYIILN